MGCCGGSGRSEARGNEITARASARAMGLRKSPRSPSRFRSKNKRISHIKEDAKTREFRDVGNKAWDQSFFGGTNGFRKGKSRQRASQGSDTSRRANRSSNGSVRSMKSPTNWAKPLPQNMLVGNSNKAGGKPAGPAQSTSFRGKLRQSQAGLQGMAKTAAGIAERGRQVSEAATKVASTFGDAGRQWNANKRPTRSI
ncbi:hypothetical protein FMUND_11353 [Fusarium mundagurra]|uniref:Uncharacterized protein n=1 Tax=Fusarium mundagurra TaxID=1567541 RepID=A0A8H5Y6R8_9HYPO|nr:hypothetical protein FMUND_11353 [Fusarium mundagurra]